MTGALLRRLAAVPFVVWVVATIVFVALRVIPGDAANNLAGGRGGAEQSAAARAALELDSSLPVQYLDFLGGIVQLDFGASFYSGRPVVDVLADTIPVTIELAIAAGLMMVLFGVATGAVAAAYRDTWIDTAVRALAAALFSIPWFFAGVALLLLFTVIWPVLPGYGRLPADLGYEPQTHFVALDAALQGRPELIGPWLERLVLPAAATGLTVAGLITRIARASFLDVLGQDHVRTARATGVGPWGIWRHHVLRNAALPITTIVGLQFGALLGGAVVSEVVFSYPGVGKLLVDTIARRDYPIVEGACIVIATCYVVANVLTDASYALLDPRLRSKSSPT